jgi:tetratricopeptide (TPR) repeat protein
VETEEELIEALKAVIHLPLNVSRGEGEGLSEHYKVGTTYPVFILTDKTGGVIKRWTGYTGGASVLISTLNSALSDLVTIDGRLAQYEANPTYKDALYLAGYFSDNGDHLRAVEFYRNAISLGSKTGYDYAFEIFKNLANAAWKDMMPVDDVFPAADAVITSKYRRANNMIKLGQIMTRLTRKLDMIDRAEKYLKAGIEATAEETNAKIKESRHNLMADYTLYIYKDTAKALQIKKASMIKGWQEERDIFFAFSKWCLERQINLEEAEMYARKTVNMVHPGSNRGRVLNTLAEICDARGNKEEAIRQIKFAIKNDPDSKYYPKQLEKFQEE